MTSCFSTCKQYLLNCVAFVLLEVVVLLLTVMTADGNDPRVGSYSEVFDLEAPALTFLLLLLIFTNKIIGKKTPLFIFPSKVEFIIN